MSLPRFEYMAPSTVSEALSLMGTDSVFVAGGTDLFIRMKDRICVPKRVIGLGNIAELHGVDLATDGDIRIGAATTLADLAARSSERIEWRALSEAIHLTASPLLRNTGTIGGNICQDTRCCYYNQPPIFRKRWPLCFKLGGDRCHVVTGSDICHAVYSGDLAGLLMAMKATVTIASPRGLRNVGMEDFFTGSGIRPTILEADEILTEIRLPSLPRTSGITYQKLRLRDTIDYPLLGISLILEFDPQEDGGQCREASFVLSATGPSPQAIHEVGKKLRGQVMTEKLQEEIGLLVKRAARPVANTASSPRYRRQMIPVLTRCAVQGAADKALKLFQGIHD